MRPWLSEDQIAALLTKTEPKNARVYIEDITWWREDMNFISSGKTIFYERAQRVSKIYFLPRENKIHIFKPPCNVFFVI